MSKQENYDSIFELTITNGENNIIPDFPNYPKCNSEYINEDGSLFVYPECAHEWTFGVEFKNSEEKKLVKDANGNILSEGDSITIIEDLKVKGSSQL